MISCYELRPHASKLESNPKIRVFAHNLKAYDGRFILRDFFPRNLVDGRVIMQGTKILCFDVANVRFQDSLNLFMCPLKNLSTTFNFSDRVVKGEFPFIFTRPHTLGYVGQTPPLSAYGYERMKPIDQKKLKDFHDSIKHRTDFNLKHEMLRYCMCDDEILLIAVQEFRITFTDVTGFDSIQNYFTLPSMSFATFRRSFLPSNTVGITPLHTYTANRKSSMIGDAYRDWIEDTHTDSVLQREQRLGICIADAFDPKTSTVYEMNGCTWHGCLSCFPTRRDVINSHTKLTHNQAYRKWEEKRKVRWWISGNANFVSKWPATTYYGHISKIASLTIESSKR